MFDLVMEIRNLITVMIQIEKDLKELTKKDKPKTGGNEK